jgi:SAM-dependent methyltransferase
MTTDEHRHGMRGAPSYVWREGQERRLAMIRRWGNPRGAQILVDGCGVGAYAEHLLEDSPHIYAFDIEYERVREARQHVPCTHVAAAEFLPYPDKTFDLVLSHEVLEHVQDDRAAIAEIARVLRPGGRAVIFCPNRWYPFETHGHYWRGKYHFGNTPLINYLPDCLRNRLAPHVRAYTWRGLHRLLEGLPVRVVCHTRLFGAYDNIIARRPRLGRALRAGLYLAEKLPLRVFGLSHLLILQRFLGP